MKYVKSEVPTMDDFMRPILEYANQCSGSFRLREITDAMADYFNLSAEARAELTEGGNIDRVYDRTSWSISHLKHAEFLRQTGRGRYEITDAGRKEVLSSNAISTAYLMQNVPAYQRWKQSRTSRKSYTANEKTSVVPVTKDFIRPILQWARGQSEEFTRQEVGDVMANYFNLSTEAKAEITRGGKIRYYSNANWAVSHLKYAGLLHQTDNGNYEITDAGRKEAFWSNEVMTEKYLMDKFSSYRIAREQASKNKDRSGATEGNREVSEVPHMTDFLRPILRWASDRSKGFNFRGATDAMADHFTLSFEARKELTRGGHVEKVYNRTKWSIIHLIHAELLMDIGEENYEITEAGRKEAFSSDERMTSTYLASNFPVYYRWRNNEKQK